MSTKKPPSDKRARVIYFSALAGHRYKMRAVNTEPVFVIDKKCAPNVAGRIQHQFRLSISPWDLRRIIKESNLMGLQGKKVADFGYDYESTCVLIGPPYHSRTPKKEKTTSTQRRR